MFATRAPRKGGVLDSTIVLRRYKHVVGSATLKRNVKIKRKQNPKERSGARSCCVILSARRPEVFCSLSHRRQKNRQHGPIAR